MLLLLVSCCCLLLLLLLLLRLLLSDFAMRAVWMSEPVFVGEIQVPPRVGPPVNAAVKKDPTIEHFHSEELPADPKRVTALPGQNPKAHRFRSPKALQYLPK